MNDLLFSPIKINSLEVKNRIYLPAMHLNMAVNFEVTDRIVDFYKERAAGGVGMIIVGYATVDEFSGNTGNIGCHTDEFIPGLSKLSNEIKASGARCGVQINHAGRYNHSFFLNGKQPVAPSPIASKLTREEPRELTADEIFKTIEAFGEAALRVKKAGFDAVEILSGTGYLISEFLSPLTNHRTDDFGGTFENRMRFGLGVVQSIRKAVGDAYPLIVRMNGNEFMPGGLSSSDLRQYAMKLDAAGVDAICVNVGWHEARVPQIVSQVPRGVFAYLARRIKELVKVPVIASHRINDPETARTLLEDEMCDMVAMGRSLIADPWLPEKAKNGRENEIVHCIACAQGCFDNLFKLKSIECLCNPRAGYEKERAVKKADVIKKILIIGGGPAGISGALAAKERGHDVVLYEKSTQLGGQLHLAAKPPGRDEFAQLIVDLINQIELNHIRVVLNQAVDEEVLGKEKPDVVLLATGAVPLNPPIPGIENSNVVQAWDVLTGKARVRRKAVVIGGGAVGVETALFLAEKGTMSSDGVKFLLVNGAEDPETLYDFASKGTKEIIVVEMIDKIGKDIGKSTKWGMLKDMKRLGIQSLSETKALEITENSVKIENKGKIEEIFADTIVMAAGSQSYAPLQDRLDEMKIPFKIIGDAQKIGTAFEAIHHGFEVGRSI